MFSILILFALVVCAATILSASPAEAHGRHRHHSHHHQTVAQPTGILAAISGGSLLNAARPDLGKGCRQLGVPCRLWCADWMNRVVERAGLRGTGSRVAKSFARWGHPSPPAVGAIVVFDRRGGGHVGVVEGFDANGNPIAISGNHGRAVREGVYPKRLVVAYRVP
jgi:hypothetical protein